MQDILHQTFKIQMHSYEEDFFDSRRSIVHDF